MTQVTDEAIARAIKELTARRGPGKSVDPAEAAQALAGAPGQGPAPRPGQDWRPLLGRVRRVAAELARAGRIDILRHGKPVDPAAMRGVVRLRARA